MTGLGIEIDIRQLADTSKELGASELQIKLALWRALGRTAKKLRTLSARGLKNQLQLRRVTELRKRLKFLKIKSSKRDGYKLWYGLNDMPVSWFKGTPKETVDGATFQGVNFPGAFVGKSHKKGRKTILKRRGNARLPVIEQLMPVKDKAMVFIEDHIFLDVEEMIYIEFYRDLQARIKYSIGKK